MSAHAADTDSSADSCPDLSDEEFTPNVHDDEARWAHMLHVFNQHAVPPTPNLDYDWPTPATMPHRWVSRNGVHYFEETDVVSIHVNGHAIYSASRADGVQFDAFPRRPYFRLQFRCLLFHFRWSLDVLGSFIRACLQSPTWRHLHITSPFSAGFQGYGMNS